MQTWLRIVQIAVFALITGAIWSVQRERGDVVNPLAVAVVGFFGTFIVTVAVSACAAVVGHRGSIDWLRSLWDLPPLGSRKAIGADNLRRK